MTQERRYLLEVKKDIDKMTLRELTAIISYADLQRKSIMLNAILDKESNGRLNNDNNI